MTSLSPSGDCKCFRSIARRHLSLGFNLEEHPARHLFLSMVEVTSPGHWTWSTLSRGLPCTSNRRAKIRCVPRRKLKLYFIIYGATGKKKNSENFFALPPLVDGTQTPLFSKLERTPLPAGWWRSYLPSSGDACLRFRFNSACFAFCSSVATNWSRAIIGANSSNARDISLISIAFTINALL